MISLNDVLLAMSNIPVDDPIAEIWGRGLQGGYKIIEYTGALPITITANGNALIDYRIYGASGGVGDRTDNIYDKNATDISKGFINNGYINSTGSAVVQSLYRVTEFIKIVGGETYTLKDMNINANLASVCFYTTSSIDNYISGIAYRARSEIIFEAPADAEYLRFSYLAANSDIAMLTEGSTAPTDYIPFGYQLPMVISDGTTETTTPVYIGDTPLGEDEYVNFGEQKIYKRTENLFDKMQYITNYISGKVVIDNGEEFIAEYNGYSTYAIPVIAGETYTLKGTTSKTIDNINWLSRVYFLNNQKQFVSRSEPFLCLTPNEVHTFTVPNNISCIELQMCNQLSYDDVMLVKGTTAPSTYIPYLQPTDPPVPLPALPTIDGTTIIDCELETKPDEMYVKYIQGGR